MSSVARTAIAALLGLALAGCSMASSTAATGIRCSIGLTSGAMMGAAAIR